MDDQLSLPPLLRVPQSTDALPPGFLWGGYERISFDPMGTMAGVQRQKIDIENAIPQRGGSFFRHYVENDTSAYKKKRVLIADRYGIKHEAWRVLRPEFENLMDDLRSGVIHGAMVYDLDRLARDPRDLEDCIDMVQKLHRRIEGYVRSLIDLSTDGGVLTARVLVATKNQQSADTSRRVRDMHRHYASRGIPVGAVAPYGWMRDRTELHPDHSAIVLKMVDMALSDRAGLSDITEYLDSEGVLTPTQIQLEDKALKFEALNRQEEAKALRAEAAKQRHWRRSSAQSILTNPRMAGYRTFKKQLIPLEDGSGKYVMGLWTPMVEPDVFDELVGVIRPKGSIRGPHNRPGRHGRRYLYSGFLRCGRIKPDGTVCMGRFSGFPAPADRPKAGHRYGCGARNKGGCGGCSVTADHVDPLLTELVLTALEEKLEQQLANPEGTPSWESQEQLDNLLQQRAELMTTFQSGGWTAGAALYVQSMNGLEASIRPLEDARKEWLGRQRGFVRQLDQPVSVRQRWADADIDQRASLISEVFDHFIVLPAPQKGRVAFDPARIVAVPAVEG